MSYIAKQEADNVRQKILNESIDHAANAAIELNDSNGNAKAEALVSIANSLLVIAAYLDDMTVGHLTVRAVVNNGMDEY